MSDNVRSFPARKVSVAFEPNADIVAQCERLLEDAKSGLLRGMAVAVVRHNGLTPDHEITRGWAFDTVVGWAMEAAIGRLQVAFVRSAMPRDGASE